MECQVPGRPAPIKTDNRPLTYGLDGLNPGQMRWYFRRASETLQRVMMDPEAPGQLKQLVREQNAIGMIVLEQLLAIHHLYETRHQDEAL